MVTQKANIINNDNVEVFSLVRKSLWNGKIGNIEQNNEEKGGEHNHDKLPNSHSEVSAESVPQR